MQLNENIIMELNNIIIMVTKTWLTVMLMKILALKV